MTAPAIFNEVAQIYDNLGQNPNDLTKQVQQRLLAQAFSRLAASMTLSVTTEALLVSGVDVSSAGAYEVVLTAARLVGAPLNGQVGDRISFTFIEDAVGGWNVTWNAIYVLNWSNAGNAANKRSSTSFVFDGTKWNQENAQSLFV